MGNLCRIFRGAGFTVVELIITMAIVAILLTLGVVNLRSTEVSGRDSERKGDISNIALFLETVYNSGTTAQPTYKGAYPPTSAVSSSANIETWFAEFDFKNLRAPGVSAPTYSITPATNAVQTTAGVTPQPTITTYVYQPIDSSGALCATLGACRKFNLYYLPEATGSTVQMTTSRNQ
jgi:prepilin-type N-terminal cleavage/methylation domain-containing protein